MRLSSFEIDTIKGAVNRFAPEAAVYLFGSRTDDTKRGGDIDLLLMSKEKLSGLCILEISDTIQQAIGEQKIDIVSAVQETEDPFVQYILPEAIKLG